MINSMEMTAPMVLEVLGIKKSGRMERVRPDRLPLMRTRKTEMAYGMDMGQNIQPLREI